MRTAVSRSVMVVTPDEQTASSTGVTPSYPQNVGADQALPRILFILVPQTGQVPLAMRRPLVSATSPSKSRFSLHFTQYPLYVSAIARSFRQGVTSRKDDAPVAQRAPGPARSDNSAHRTVQQRIDRGFGGTCAGGCRSHSGSSATHIPQTCRRTCPINPPRRPPDVRSGIRCDIHRRTLLESPPRTSRGRVAADAKLAG